MLLNCVLDLRKEAKIIPPRAGFHKVKYTETSIVMYAQRKWLSIKL